jgi:hypothetical protein
MVAPLLRGQKLVRVRAFCGLQLPAQGCGPKTLFCMPEIKDVEVIVQNNGLETRVFHDEFFDRFLMFFQYLFHVFFQ